MTDMRSALCTGLGLFVMASLLAGTVPGIAFADTVSVSIDGKSYDIEYAGTGASITASDVDTDFVSLILSLDVTDAGTLEITLPRDAIDYQFDGMDEEFIVLVDGDESDFTETDTTPESRTLVISLDAGAEEIEIVGSSFGNESVIEETAQQPPAPESGEEPAAQEPAVEDPAVPELTCGEGTVLQDGLCVAACGTGLVLEDGVCVVDQGTTPEEPETESAVAGLTCGEGTVLQDGLCVAACGTGLVLEDGVCVVDQGTTPEEPETESAVAGLTCGEGTVLQDGLCVAACGTGLVLEDGVCVVDQGTTPEEPAAQPVERAAAESKPSSSGRDLIQGVAAAFIVALAVMIILGLMSRAGRSRD